MASLTRNVPVTPRAGISPLASEAAAENSLSISHSNSLLLGLAVVVAAFGWVILAMRWHQPLLGMHSFRQTQTAITAYSIYHGGPWFAYETPVLGPPWSIPFEFPLYQLMVAGVARLTGIGIDPAGRLLSYLFLLLTIIPIRLLVRTYRLRAETGWIAAILILASPLYLYWGTAHLIETLALMLGFAFLAEASRALEGDAGWLRTLSAISFGILAALCKITTFAPFYGLTGCALLASLNSYRKSGRSWLIPLIRSGAIMTLPPLSFLLWDRYADRHRLANPIARFMASKAPMLHDWTFGTWSELFSAATPATLMRSITDTFGIAASLLLLAILIVAVGSRLLSKLESLIVVATVAAFLAPYAVFTHLHVVHNYYDSENAIFLLCAVAIILGRLLASGASKLAWSGLAAVVASQAIWFAIHFLPDVRHPRGPTLIAIADRLKNETPPDSMIVIYGWEWSPVIPYYAERHALMEPTFVPKQERMDRLNRWTADGGAEGIGAFVRCRSSFDSDPDFARAFGLIEQRYRQEQVGGCRLYFVERPAHRS